MRYVVVGDGESPHLLKWVCTLQAVGGLALELWLVSSRGLMPALESRVPPERRLLLHTLPEAAGGNVGLLLHLPRVASWLRAVRPDIVHAHYLTSHGTLALLAQRLWRIPGRLVTSAWGSDVLLTPQRNALLRTLTSAVLRGSVCSTSDSHHMAGEMRRLGARHVLVFPFGLSELPPVTAPSIREPLLFFSNRGLEPLYRIDRVLRLFAAVAAEHPAARLVIANRGRAETDLRALTRTLGLLEKVRFVGMLEPQEQAQWYARAQWHLSLPRSDSVSVSVIEAMAHGCVPVLSDLPANRELVDDALNGLILPDDDARAAAALKGQLNVLLNRAEDIALRNRKWVAEHGLFPPRVEAFLAELSRLAADAKPMDG